MPADLVDQLELLGRVLDRAAPPLTVDELLSRMPSDDVPGLDLDVAAGRDGHEVSLVPASDPVFPHRASIRLLALAAAVVLVVAGLVVLAGRPGADDGRPAAGDTVAGPVPVTTVVGTSDAVVPTTDPLAALEVAPGDGDVPTDLVQRFSSPLADGGRIWVYDSASTEGVYFVRHLGDGSGGFGWLDREAYDAGQGWSLEGTPGRQLLWGITSPSNPVAVTVGDATVTSDADGLWSVVPPADATSFTLTTSTGTTTHDILTDPSVATTVYVTAPPASEVAMTTVPPTIEPDSALAQAMQPTGTVLVVNASSSDGLAMSLTGALRRSGYDVVDPVSPADGVELATSAVYSKPDAPLATLNAITDAVEIPYGEDLHGQSIPALDEQMLASADIIVVLGNDLADAPWEGHDPLIDLDAAGILLVLDATTTADGHQHATELMGQLASSGVTVVAGGATTRSVGGSMFMPLGGSTPWAFAVAQLAGIGGFDGWDPTLVADALSPDITGVLVVADA